VEYVRPL